jgi:serine/threonine protein kinase
VSSVRTNTIGKYHLTKLVGQGGMGSVYIATDAVLGRQVAVKVLHSHLCRSAEMLERFRNEAVTHARLEHANIVRLYDFLTEEGLSLIAMEYVVGGRNLGDLIEKGSLPQRGVCDVMRQVLRGVAYAHGEGVVHRDVKPANILLGEERGRIRPKLTDFGIAKALHTMSMTQPGSVLGTVDYMSPEQCLGQPVDSRSDLYSLGVVFYECLTGRVPFRAATEYQVMQAHVDNLPDRPDKYAPELLPGLTAVVLRLLEKEPARRYQTAVEVLDDLDALQEDLERLTEPTLELPPARITAMPDDEVSQVLVGPTMLAGLAAAAALPSSQTAATVQATTGSPLRVEGGVSRPQMTRPATRSGEAPPATASPTEPEPAAAPARRSSALPWVLVVLLLLGAGGYALWWFKPWEQRSAEPSGASPGPAVADVEHGGLQQLIAAGKHAEALDAVLARLAQSSTTADAAALAEILENAAGVLPPERRTQAAQALEKLLHPAEVGRQPEPELVRAALRGARALAAAGAVGDARSIVQSVMALELELDAVGEALVALAQAVPLARDYPEAAEVVRLLSGVSPNSKLYESARRALGTAKEGLVARERSAAEEALRGGRWVDAQASLERLKKDLGDSTESTRQLDLKAKDLQGSGTPGACVPVGLARLRDPTAPSRAVGRPQVAWTGEDYLVVWSDGRAAPEGSTAQQVYLQRLDASGKRLIESDRVVSAPGVDAGRPTIECLDKQCGVTWDEFTGQVRQVQFQAFDFLGNPVADPVLVDTGVSPSAYPTVAASKADGQVVYAVSWVDREPVDAAGQVQREAASIVFLDHEGRVLDGPRFLRTPPPEEPTKGRRGRPVVRPRIPVTRLPHVVGLGVAGFAASWEEELDGIVGVRVASFGPRGGEPRWLQRVSVADKPARDVEGRVPFVTFLADALRLAVVWIDRAPALDALHVTILDMSGNAVSDAVAARGAFRYHGALFVGDGLVVTRWTRGRAATLGLAFCPRGACPAPPDGVETPGDFPLMALGGRVGLAPGAAQGEFAAVWRERPGFTAAEGEAEDTLAVGDELFFVRFRCEAQTPAAVPDTDAGAVAPETDGGAPAPDAA